MSSNTVYPRNKEEITAPPSIPRLVFKKSYTSPICESDCENTPHPPPPYQGYKHYCCQKQTTVNLTIHLGSRSSSEEEEASILISLRELATTYKRILKVIEKEFMNPDLKQNEIAACDVWWNETTEKLRATKKLVDLLENV